MPGPGFAQVRPSDPSWDSSAELRWEQHLSTQLLAGGQPHCPFYHMAPGLEQESMRPTQRSREKTSLGILKYCSMKLPLDASQSHQPISHSSSALVAEAEFSATRQVQSNKSSPSTQTPVPDTSLTCPEGNFVS